MHSPFFGIWKSENGKTETPFHFVLCVCSFPEGTNYPAKISQKNSIPTPVL